MPVIKSPLLFESANGCKNMNVIFDSSVNISCINAIQLTDFAEIQQLGRFRNISFSADSKPIVVKHVVCLDFFINGILLSDEFFVVSHLYIDAIIGMPTIRKWRIKLNFEDDKVEVDPKVAELQLI